MKQNMSNSYFLKDLFNSVYVYLSVFTHVAALAEARRGQALDLLELQLQALVSYPMWMLGSELWASSLGSTHF